MIKKLAFLTIFIFCAACTSNTIFKEPENLIPKDTMSLIIQDLMIASSSKYMTNKFSEKNINYMPLVYKRFKIDSGRFQTSNLYYMSKIDEYQAIFEDAQTSLESVKAIYDKQKRLQDSLRKDSLNISKKLNEKELDLNELDDKLEDLEPPKELP